MFHCNKLKTNYPQFPLLQTVNANYATHAFNKKQLKVSHLLSG